MENLIIGFVAGLFVMLALFFVKIRPKCKSCDAMAARAGLFEGHADSAEEQVEYFKDLTDRLLLSRGIQPVRKPKEVIEEEKEEAAENAQIEHALKSGGDVFGG